MGTKKQTFKSYDPAKLKEGRHKAKFASTYISVERHLESLGCAFYGQIVISDKLLADIEKVGKQVDFAGVFDGHTVEIFGFYGSKKVRVSYCNVTKQKDVTRRRRMMKGLYEKTKLVDEKTWKLFDHYNPDPKVVKQLQEALRDFRLNHKRYGEDVRSLKAFKYKTHGRMIMSSELWPILRKKKLGRYFDFVRAIDDREDPTDIYELYVDKNAKKRVRLSSSVWKKIDDAYDEAQPIDLSPARSEIVGSIDDKIVPVARKELLADLKKRIDSNRRQMAKVEAVMSDRNIPEK